MVVFIRRGIRSARTYMSVPALASALLTWGCDEDVLITAPSDPPRPPSEQEPTPESPKVTRDPGVRALSSRVEFSGGGQRLQGQRYRVEVEFAPALLGPKTSLVSPDPAVRR